VIEYAPRELGGVTRTLGDRQLVPGSSILTSLLLAPPARLTDAEQLRSDPRQTTVAVLLAATAPRGASAAATQAHDKQIERQARFTVSPHSADGYRQLIVTLLRAVRKGPEPAEW
jgi:hypothetical protein